jgi:hypothetical protein
MSWFPLFLPFLLLLFLLPPYWSLWPWNGGRYKLRATRAEGINGCRIIFLPKAKDIGPFIPDNIQITKTWFSWNIFIWGDPRCRCFRMTKDRLPGEPWPDPKTIMQWACQHAIDWNNPYALQTPLGHTVATMEKIQEYVPGYVRPTPKPFSCFPEDF